MAISADVLSIATTIVTLVHVVAQPQQASSGGFSFALWTYPSLPVAIVGLSLLVGEWKFPRTKAGGWLLFGFTTLVLLIVGVVVAVVLWRYTNNTVVHPGESPTNLWFLSTVFYAYMAFPTIIFGGKVYGLSTILAWFARVGGVGFDAISHSGEPYCAIQGPAFGIVYCTLGGVATVFAFFGAVYHSSDNALPEHVRVARAREAEVAFASKRENWTFRECMKYGFRGVLPKRYYDTDPTTNPRGSPEKTANVVTIENTALPYQ